MKTKTMFAAIMLLAMSCKKENTTLQASDITKESSAQDVLSGSNESEVYASVKLGRLVVMKKNLNVSRYRNGDIIPQVTDPAAWKALTTGAWCYYNNDPAIGAVYGKLYNWYAVNDPRGLAPLGWHIPSDAEWTAGALLLGGDYAAGGKMKSTGTIEAGTGLWRDPNEGATNSSGFTGLPGGLRFNLIPYDFLNIGYNGYWWTATENSTSDAWSRGLLWIYDDLIRSTYVKQNGLSVRCVKD